VSLLIKNINILKYKYIKLKTLLLFLKEKTIYKKIRNGCWLSSQPFGGGLATPS
jgi:hypothetical protein